MVITALIFRPLGEANIGSVHNSDKLYLLNGKSKLVSNRRLMHLEVTDKHYHSFGDEFMFT